MALTWMWDFGINLPVAAYNGSAWGPSTTTSVIDTAYTGTLQSPSGGGITPGDTHVCRLNASPQLLSPVLPSSLTQGWLCARFHWLAGSISTSSARPMITGKLSGTERFEIRGGGSGTAGVPIALYVATTLIGTSTSTYSIGDTLNLAVQFDVSGTNHSAGLYIDGVEEVAYTAGSGSPGATTINQMEIGAPNCDCTWNTLRVYSSRATDQTDAINVDVWSTTLAVDGVANDTNWTIFGGAGSKVASLTDGSSATGVESTTDPSSFDMTCEGRDDVLAGWAPAVVFAAQAVMFASGDVLTDVNLKISDNDGVINQVSVNPLPATPDFVTQLVTLDSLGAALTGTRIDQFSMTYTVT